MDCKIHWYANLDPNVNRSPWTKQEEAQLEALVKKYNGYHWEDIAAELGVLFIL
jgi:hypothetical protein